MSDHTEAERLALITHEQVRLVNSEAYFLQRAVAGVTDDFEDQDDVNCHHGHSGRGAPRPLTATILQFKARGRDEADRRGGFLMWASELRPKGLSSFGCQGG
jgi:hypothetical protein